MSSEMPVSVSVVVAAYGDVPYLEETLTSLLSTQPDEVPIFVLDDASPTDEVRQIAKKFIPRIQYIRSEVNRGVSGSFNAAADLVSTEYLMLVGPDDRLTLSLTEFMNQQDSQSLESVVIQPGVEVIDSGGKRVKPLSDRVKNVVAPKNDSVHSGESLACTLLKGDWVYNPSLLWKVSYLKNLRYDETLKTAMDLDILLRLTFDGQKLYRSSLNVFEYRRHAEAVSSKNAGTQRLGEELAIHKLAYIQSQKRNWNKASRWAKIALTPRLHAVLLLRNLPKDDRKLLLSLVIKGIGL